MTFILWARWEIIRRIVAGMAKPRKPSASRQTSGIILDSGTRDGSQGHAHP